MEDCIFCKIIKGEIPSTKVYEDEYVLAFEEIAPRAAVHVLLIPKIHIRNITEIGDPTLAAAMFAGVAKVAEIKGIKESGFRTVANTGAHACQSVQHFHMHIIGGEQLTEGMN